MRRVARSLLVRWLRRRPWSPRWLRVIVALALSTMVLVSVVSPAYSSSSSAPRRPSVVVPATLPHLATASGPYRALGGPPTTLPNAPRKSPEPQPAGAPITVFPSSAEMVAQGQTLYEEGCASCHGALLQGIHGVAPSLIGVGAGPVDFYLSTGRMPLDNPLEEPGRNSVGYTRQQIYAIIAFITKVGGGPPAPAVDPSRGSLSTGLQQFTLHCAGCHQLVARGGLTIGAYVPNLQDADALQIAEAVRMGPYLMPHFDSTEINQYDLNSIARYVLWTRHPSDLGGWGIYNIGPIPEGLVTFFIALLAMIIVARLIGERMTTE